MNLPLRDPQFWIVTALVVATLLVALRRAFGARRDPALPCARCPKAAAHGRASAAPAGSRRWPAALVALALAASPGAAERAERQVAAMGTTLTVAVDTATREAALMVAEELIAAVAETEARLSTRSETSELSRLNRAPEGEPFVLSEATWNDLTRVLACSEATGGAFEPTMAPLNEAWGLQSGGRLPSEAELAAARALVGIAGRLSPRPAERAVVKRAALRFDESGFGRGAALGRALAAAVERRVAAHLDLGGLLAWEMSRKALAVEIADPRDRARPALRFEIRRRNGSLATSGNSEPAVAVGGERIGHRLDPATGRPAPDFGSVTVLTAEPLRADCLASALFVMGPERGLAWARAHPGDEVAYLIVEGDRLVVRATPMLQGRLRALAPEVELRYEPRARRKPS